MTTSGFGRNEHLVPRKTIVQGNDVAFQYRKKKPYVQGNFSVEILTYTVCRGTCHEARSFSRLRLYTKRRRRRTKQ